jgi:hypothetical protein
VSTALGIISLSARIGADGIKGGRALIASNKYSYITEAACNIGFGGLGKGLLKGAERFVGKTLARSDKVIVSTLIDAHMSTFSWATGTVIGNKAGW